jgi:hypothetical protein
MKEIGLTENPRLNELIVADLVAELKGLDWLQYVYGVCEYGVNDDDETFPIIHDSDGEYIDLLPDDDVMAYSFFEDNNMLIGVDGNLNQYDMSLYVWLRLDKIVADCKDTTKRMLGDVLLILRKYDVFGVGVDLKDPFANFTAFVYDDNSMIMRNRSGFRIDFSVWGEDNLCESEV